MKKASQASTLFSGFGRLIEHARRWNAALSARPSLSFGLVFILALLLAFVGAVGVGFPEPTVHDENSYLLAGETFAAGRLANPPHPMAEFLQTFHVLQRPTYASKYPPAQGLWLALGIKLAGTPIVGVWLSFATMCAAMYWMLRAWVGPRWALVGAVAFAARLASTYWTYQYWGGSVPALGGALVLGGAQRVVETARPRDAILMTIGAAILANSRPYEGLLLCVPVAAVLIWWLVRRTDVGVRRRIQSVVLPALVVSAVVAALMLRYNHAVTGRATRFPYLAYLEEYGRGPDFLWQKPSDAPLSTDPLMRRYQEWELATADSLRSPGRFVSRNIDRMTETFGFFLQASLLAPLFVLPIALRRPWVRLACLSLALVLTGLMLSSWYQLHYAAPAAGLFLILYMTCLAWCRRLRLGRFDAGKYFVVLILFVWMASQLAKLGVPAARVLMTGATPEWTHWARRRADLQRRLESAGGKDLVIVRYGLQHDVHHEWVRNAADIDRSPVVWAHDLGLAKNARLLEYFHDRKAWLLEVKDPEGEETIREYDRAVSDEADAANGSSPRR